MDQVTFRISRISLLAVALSVVCASPFAFTAPGFVAIYLIPIALLWWIFRNQTTINHDAIRVRTTFGSREVLWDDVTGIKVHPSRWLKVELRDGSTMRLSAVRAMHLPTIAVASGGRIADIGQGETEQPTPVPDSPDTESDAANTDSDDLENTTEQRTRPDTGDNS